MAGSCVPSGTEISAAAEGVGARRSAAKSARVTSLSWPTPTTTGNGDATTVRTTCSSLNPHRSSIEPPPRARMTRSRSRTAYRRFRARMMAGAAMPPCTAAGDRTTSTIG